MQSLNDIILEITKFYKNKISYIILEDQENFSSQYYYAYYYSYIFVTNLPIPKLESTFPNPAIV